MVDHFSDLTYMNVMRSTNQEDNLAVKPSFERWAEKFGVKIKGYHAANESFLNNLSDQQLRILTKL